MVVLKTVITRALHVIVSGGREWDHGGPTNSYVDSRAEYNCMRSKRNGRQLAMLLLKYRIAGNFRGAKYSWFLWLEV